MKILMWLVIFGVPALAQSISAPAASTLDFSHAKATKISRSGTGSPNGRDTCTPVEEYVQTDATPGQNKWYCTATPSVWTQASVGPAGPGGTCSPTGLAGQLLTDTGSSSCTSLTDFVFTTHTIAMGSLGILNLSSASPTAGFRVPTAAGAAPTTDGVESFNSTTHTKVFGSNGSTVVSAVAATGASTGTTCSNQFFRTISGIAAPTCASIGQPDLPAASRVRGIPFSIGVPGGTALTAGSTTTDYFVVPVACTISAWTLMVDAGTVTVKFWKVASGTALPTSANSINTSGVSISSGTAVHSTTLTDFTTTAVAAYDLAAMNVTAVATAGYVNGLLECDQ